MFQIFYALTCLVLFIPLLNLPTLRFPSNLLSGFSGFLKRVYKDPPVVNRTCTMDCAFLVLWAISPLWLIPSIWLHTAVSAFAHHQPFFPVFFSPPFLLTCWSISFCQTFFSCTSIWLVPSFSSLFSSPLSGLPLLPRVTPSAAF